MFRLFRLEGDLDIAIWKFEGECIIPMFVTVILEGEGSIPLFGERESNLPFDAFNDAFNFKFVLVLLGGSFRLRGFIIS